MEEIQKLRHRTIELVATLPDTIGHAFIKLASFLVFKVHIDQELTELKLQKEYENKWKQRNISKKRKSKN